MYTGGSLLVISRLKVFIFPGHMVNGYEYFPDNDDNSLFMAVALLQILILIIKTGLFHCDLDCCKDTLNWHKVKVMVAFTNSCGFFSAGAVIVVGESPA